MFELSLGHPLTDVSCKWNTPTIPLWGNWLQEVAEVPNADKGSEFI